MRKGDNKKELKKNKRRKEKEKEEQACKDFNLRFYAP